MKRQHRSAGRRAPHCDQDHDQFSVTRVNHRFGVGLHHDSFSRGTEQRSLGPDLELAGDIVQGEIL